jgi:lipopolysaccharide/colanic/teichoic acid biosynthesis glycosyltransferase
VLDRTALDRTAAALAIVVLMPVIALALAATWAVDRRNPVYVSLRAGRNGVAFRMLKIRTMIVTDGRSGQMTTAADDPRLTWLGRLLRGCKLDELLQLVNIVRGEMSVVGPRPQLLPEVATYTEEERGLLGVAPGLTDFSSIIFWDLAEIVRAKPDAHLAYQQLVRPWKSRLGLFYVRHSSVPLDMLIVLATLCSMVHRPTGLALVVWTLRVWGAQQDLIAVARRSEPLKPTPPPGAARVVGT